MQGEAWEWPGAVLSVKGAHGPRAVVPGVMGEALDYEMRTHGPQAWFLSLTT